MVPYTFRDYVAPASGKNKIAEWLDEQPVDVRTDMDVIVRHLSVSDLAWQAPDFKWLKGKYKGIGELRTTVANVQYRLLMFREVDTCYLLIGCTHKAQVYKPSSALDTSLVRREEIRKGVANTDEHH